MSPFYEIIKSVTLSQFTTSSGTWKERLTDRLNDRKEKSEKYLTENLHVSITSSMRITYKGLMFFRKVVNTYLDLCNDCILLTTVVVVLGIFATDSNITTQDFSTFPFQVALILSVSIILPVLTSAAMIAYKRPLIILSAQQATLFTKTNDQLVIWISRAVIFFLFPIVPAWVVISAENAKEQRASLKPKGHKN